MPDPNAWNETANCALATGMPGGRGIGDTKAGLQPEVFLDEFPRVTDLTYHPPDMYTHDELIRRVRAADSELPQWYADHCH